MGGFRGSRRLDGVKTESIEVVGRRKRYMQVRDAENPERGLMSSSLARVCIEDRTRFAGMCINETVDGLHLLQQA